MNSAFLFSEGVRLEGVDSKLAVQVYLKLLEAEPDYAEAHINLGTLLYRSHEYKQAEMHYRAALAIEPDYVLALFDLANVYDETDRVAEAIELYEKAVKLVPSYEDAHYNLALAYEKIGEPGKALLHWRRYRALDAGSPWATMAKRRETGITKKSGLSLIVNNGSAAHRGDSKLFLVKR